MATINRLQSEEKTGEDGKDGYQNTRHDAGSARWSKPHRKEWYQRQNGHSLECHGIGKESALNHAIACHEYRPEKCQDRSDQEAKQRNASGVHQPFGEFRPSDAIQESVVNDRMGWRHNELAILAQNEIVHHIPNTNEGPKSGKWRRVGFQQLGLSAHEWASLKDSDTLPHISANSGE